MKRLLKWIHREHGFCFRSNAADDVVLKSVKEIAGGRADEAMILKHCCNPGDSNREVARAFVDWFNSDPKKLKHKKSQLGPMAGFISLVVGPFKKLQMGPLDTCNKAAVLELYDQRLGTKSANTTALYARMRAWSRFDENRLHGLDPALHTPNHACAKTIKAIWDAAKPQFGGGRSDWKKQTTYNWKFVESAVEEQYQSEAASRHQSIPKRSIQSIPKRSKKPRRSLSNTSTTENTTTTPTGTEDGGATADTGTANRAAADTPLVYFLKHGDQFTELVLFHLPACDGREIRRQLVEGNCVIAHGRQVTVQLMLSPSRDLGNIVPAGDPLSDILSNPSLEVTLAPNQRLPPHENTLCHTFRNEVQSVNVTCCPNGLIVYGSISLGDVTIAVNLPDAPAKTSNHYQSKFGGFDLSFKGGKKEAKEPDSVEAADAADVRTPGQSGKRVTQTLVQTLCFVSLSCPLSSTLSLHLLLFDLTLLGVPVFRSPFARQRSSSFVLLCLVHVASIEPSGAAVSPRSATVSAVICASRHAR